MLIAIGINHMRCPCLDVTDATFFCSDDVTITHQYYLVAINMYDAMHHITAAVYPGKYHITDSRISRFLQDDTLFPTDDEREHAVTLDRQRHANSIVHQTGCFF